YSTPPFAPTAATYSLHTHNGADDINLNPSHIVDAISSNNVLSSLPTRIPLYLDSVQPQPCHSVKPRRPNLMCFSFHLYPCRCDDSKSRQSQFCADGTVVRGWALCCLVDLPR
ncbi:hypothetical protein PIB30_092334, partial [Stylosanthes scabra]|nr:hypothetical protein [Stylosanthes scabra]